MTKGTLLQNASYLAGDGLTPTRGDILIKEGKIADLGQGLSPEAGLAVVDASHYLVTPGFVNTHSHAAMSLLRGHGGDQNLKTWLTEYIWPVEARLTDEDVYWGTLLSLVEMLAAGVTVVADMYDHMDAVAQACLDAGIRANLSRGMIGFNDDDRHSLKENDALYDRWHNAADGRIKVWYGPHATNTCSPDYLAEVSAHAQSRETGIHIHVSETKEEFDELQEKYGQTPVALAQAAGLFKGPCLIAHGVWLTEADKTILAANGVGLAHNPTSNMKLASGACPVADLRQAGVKVGIGTDGASSNNAQSVLRDAQLAALMQKLTYLDPTLVSAQEALTMATIEGAQALHWDEEIGSITVGKAADLVCFNTDKPWWIPNHDPAATLIYAAHSDDVDRVYAAGQLVYHQGDWPQLDTERIFHEGRSRAKKLLQG